MKLSGCGRLECIPSVFLPGVIQLGREKELARHRGFPAERCKCCFETNWYDLIKHQSVVRFFIGFDNIKDLWERIRTEIKGKKAVR